ncbi:MAG: sugar phosphate isomerase/epimerase family protein [Fimbriimonas sp.]
MSDIAVSSWALHRTLGMTYPDSPSLGRRSGEKHGAGEPLPLTHLASALERRGFRQVQLCHFHLASREPGYLRELRASIEDAGVKLLALLIDDGDLAHPEHGDRDADWIAGWLDVAQTLGAERARIIAGRQPFNAETMRAAVARIDRLADAAGPVRLETENWHELMSTPEAVHAVLDALEGRLGLCADWGNWPRPAKYEGLRSIFPRAETCHAKLEFLTPESLDEEDAARCLDIAKSTGFAGPYVLVNGGSGNEWDALEIQRDAILQAV